MFPIYICKDFIISVSNIPDETRIYWPFLFLVWVSISGKIRRDLGLSWYWPHNEIAEISRLKNLGCNLYIPKRMQALIVTHGMELSRSKNGPCLVTFMAQSYGKSSSCWWARANSNSPGEADFPKHLVVKPSHKIILLLFLLTFYHLNDFRNSSIGNMIGCMHMELKFLQKWL